VFNLAKSEGIIEVFQPLDLIEKNQAKLIGKQTWKDRKQLAHYFPKQIKLPRDEEEARKVPGLVYIEGEEYCYPHIWSINMSLKLSQMLGAQCLFNPRSLNYCKYKFGLDSIPLGAQTGVPEAFESIFQAYVPN
jgi:hypothetical protein